MGQNKEQLLKWLQGRQEGVGSSDSPVLALPTEKVFGKTATDLYISKVRPITMDDIEDEEDNPNFRRGHVYEPLAVAMFEAQTGIKVYAPVTDEERFSGFQVKDPNSPMFCDFDGFCEDGWVYEGKAPIQRVCDSFRTQGIREYYMVQGQHLAHLAHVCELPFLPDPRKWLGKIKGTRLVVYEPEKVQLQIVEIPIDHEMIDAIVRNANVFYHDHVEKRIPPKAVIYEQPVTKKATKGDYKEMTSEDWQRAVDVFLLAKEQSVMAEQRVSVAKAGLEQKLKDAGEESVNVGPHKFKYRQMAGQKRFDQQALQAAFPTLNLDDYMKQGAPFEQFNYYGPKVQDNGGDVDLDKQIMTIHTELENFAAQKMDSEAAMELFEDLRSRADMYAAVLEMDLGMIRRGIDKAVESIVKGFGQ